MHAIICHSYKLFQEQKENICPRSQKLSWDVSTKSRKINWSNTTSLRSPYFTGATSGTGTAYPSEAHEFTHVFKSIFRLICMFCRSLFVLLAFFFWSLCCLSFFALQILITTLILQTILILNMFKIYLLTVHI